MTKREGSGRREPAEKDNPALHATDSAATTATATTAAEAAAKRRRFARDFARQVAVWAIVCAFLALVNALTSPHYWWVVWVLAGWGFQLLLQFGLYLFDSEDDDAKRA